MGTFSPSFRKSINQGGCCSCFYNKRSDKFVDQNFCFASKPVKCVGGIIWGKKMFSGKILVYLTDKSSKNNLKIDQKGRFFLQAHSELALGSGVKILTSLNSQFYQQRKIAGLSTCMVRLTRLAQSSTKFVSNGEISPLSSKQGSWTSALVGHHLISALVGHQNSKSYEAEIFCSCVSHLQPLRNVHV